VQVDDKLVLRLRTPVSDLNYQLEIHVPRVFAAHEWVDLNIFITPGAIAHRGRWKDVSAQDAADGAARRLESKLSARGGQRADH
jgi:hypothetical protein